MYRGGVAEMAFPPRKPPVLQCLKGEEIIGRSALEVLLLYQIAIGP